MVTLVAKFGVAAKALRSDPGDRLSIPTVRDSLAEAGHHLLRLIHHGVIEMPTTLPSWLSWSVRTTSRRPRFQGFHAKSQIMPLGRGRKLSEFIGMLLVPRMVGDKQTLSSSSENSPRRFRYRHVFLEAIDWLGRRSKPRIEVALPSMALDITDADGESSKVTPVVVDWDDHSPDECRLLFAQIAEAASQICDQMATEAEEKALKPKTGSEPPIDGPPATVASSPSAPTDRAGERTKLDEHVERAFDLLKHYQGFVCRTLEPRPEITRAMDQIEVVLREWLPLAQPAGDLLINGVAAVVGDRDAAAKLLRDVDLWLARHERLKALAAAAIPTNLGTTEAIALVRREIQQWRGLLPRIWQRHDGKSYVNEQDRARAKEPGWYWSSGVDVRPSRLGASYFLACACEGIAEAAARMRITPEVFRPAVLLSTGLRRTPTCAGLESPELESVLEEQIATAQRVDDLLAEMEVLHRAAEPRTAKQSQADADTQAAHEATMARIEQTRREHKWRRMDHECETVPQMYSLWQETTDLLFRSNLGDDTRVEELVHLRQITFALAAAAHERQMPRANLQTLQGILATLMPREWFHDTAERISVRNLVGAANAEAQDLYFAYLRQQRSGPDSDGFAESGGVEGREQPREDGADTLQPSAHQELVIATLRRDGRLRTGVLWERISPKHIDLRAHQNAMRDLVKHGLVLTAGKGQATEYVLP